ncbi:sensor histidine kinase [Myxococcus sp. NMCA1]|uniref:sensor histidine kinase n=1 Tax=Myxococcus sp. NMCA1 TaxID=2996785 RepID=UPI0022855806|nr:ATP-binding protein [Myxococcus sp. NMCA1]WAM27144.1 ATP-binding protein [Myxococcus sp. NMCA1]
MRPATLSATSPPELESQLELRRRNFLLCAAGLALSLVMQPLTLGQVVTQMLWVHLGWCAAFIFLGVAVGARWLSPRTSGLAAAVVSLVGLTLDIHFTGGIYSPFFPSLYAVPLIICVFTPGHRRPTQLASALTLVSMWVTCWTSGASLQVAVSQGLSFAFVAWVSVLGSQTFRRLRDAERAADEERVVALERLAESERLRAQVDLHRAEMERLALVGQLAAGVAHQVNNPLSYVKSNLGYLDEELREPSPDVEDLRRVVDETQQGVLRIQQIVTELRDFSRANAQDEEACVVAEALAKARWLASAELRGLSEVVEDVPPDLPRVRMGLGRLVEVLVKLLLNAAQAADDARPRRPGRIILRARTFQDGVRLEVEDNGAGIPESMLPRLFEPFSAVPRAKAAGLALSVCRDQVESVGGTLSAENHPDGGTRFVLDLQPAPMPAPV